jgi:hypothetical protein
LLWKPRQRWILDVSSKREDVTTRLAGTGAIVTRLV